MSYLRRNSSNLNLTATAHDSAPQTSKSQKRYMHDLQSEVTKSRMAIVILSALRKILVKGKPLTRTFTKKLKNSRKSFTSVLSVSITKPVKTYITHHSDHPEGAHRSAKGLDEYGAGSAT